MNGIQLPNTESRLIPNIPNDIRTFEDLYILVEGKNGSTHGVLKKAFIRSIDNTNKPAYMMVVLDDLLNDYTGEFSKIPTTEFCKDLTVNLEFDAYAIQVANKNAAATATANANINAFF